MAFDVKSFVSRQTASTAGSFDVAGFVSRLGVPRKPDPTTTEGLAQIGRNAGLESEVNAILDNRPKLSFLQRLSKGIGAFNPAEALLTGAEKGAPEGVKTYVKNVVQGLGSAVTGTDYEGERRTFADAAQKFGVTNGIAKFGIGFLGDVLLDPTTYFGGAIARGITAGAVKTADIGLSTLGRVAPKVEEGLRLAGQGAKEAAGKAFVFGYGTSKGVPEAALEVQSKIAKAKEGIVASNLSRLGTGTLAPSQQEELVQKLLAGKRAEFATGRGTLEAKTAAREAAVSTDPLVQQTIEGQGVRSKKFAEQAGVSDPFEVYFPGLKKDKVQKFVEGTRSLRVGSEGYLKQFRDLLTDEQLVRNPAEAFAKREFEVAKNGIVRSELRKLVRDVGKPVGAFATEDDALKAGYRVVKEKGQFGKVIGYLAENDKRFLDSLISPEFSTIDTIAKATGFDALTSLFKRSVTGLFAPFHVRNFVSGHIQNFEVLGKDALNPKAIAAGQKLAWKLSRGETAFASETVNVGGREVNLGKVMKAFADRFDTSSQYIGDIADATKGAGTAPGAILSKESAKETVATLGLGQQAIPFRAARAVGNFIETQQKATAYLVALGQGKTVPEALKLAERAGFDYRALTAFESKVLRRVIPFYSFTRKNIELQLRTVGENPERINQVLAFFTNLGDQPSAEERRSLPEYLQATLGIKLSDTPEGLKQYISSFGTPVEAFADLFNKNPILKAISQMNPLIKAPIEIGIGKDSFRQRDLKDVYDAREYKAAPQFVKDLLGIKKETKSVFTTVNGKSVKSGDRVVYVADPMKLLVARSLFTARGFSYLDQAFGGDLQGFAKALRLTTGLKPQQVDLEQTKYFAERDKERELQDLLQRHGKVSTFERAFVPKK